MSRRGLASLAAALSCVLVGGGCTDAPEPRDGTDAWPSAATPVATDGLVWAAGREVHLADGSTIEAGQDLTTYVVAGPGVFYFTDDSDFVLATPDGEVVATDANPYAPSLSTSADGRWLAFLDQPDGDDGRREAVVVDLVEGTEVVRSSDGLVPDDADDVDWADLYEDSPNDVLGIHDGVAYVDGLDGTLAYDLATGESELVDPAPVFPRREPPYWNPSHTWQVPAQPFDAVPVLAPEAGKPVRTSFEKSSSSPPPLPGEPDLTSWTLTGWLDDETAVGLTRTLDDFEPLPVLLTCAVPDGRCEVVPGAEAGVSLPADRPSGLPSLPPTDG